jgi:TPR repeat protein
MHLRTLLAISAMLCCNAAVGGLKEGYEALSKQDYATAIKEYRPLAERGNAEAQYRIGRMYEFGKGYPKDQGDLSLPPLALWSIVSLQRTGRNAWSKTWSATRRPWAIPSRLSKLQWMPR